MAAARTEIGGQTKVVLVVLGGPWWSWLRVVRDEDTSRSDSHDLWKGKDEIDRNCGTGQKH
jgi:hypothetical protein